MAENDSLRIRIAKLIGGDSLSSLLAAVSVQVDDSPGWTSLTGRPHEYDQSKIQSLYEDSLQAWRKNPIAWRIIGITTDYVVGDRFQVTSNKANLQRFIEKFWNHPKNRMELRLDGMCDELSRAGDLFVVLFRNPNDGLSYIRFVTKDRIVRIETAANDWETELAYHELQDAGDPKIWLSPDNPKSENYDSIMLHYSVNRPIGALLGEGDLTTMIPWLQRYSRMLEDRVRLHWAVRAFLWMVTVPANKVAAKREQYRTPPESGSVVVKDELETWEPVSPLLRGSDASHDLQAVRQMVDAGSGYPPHWRGEASDANLATATAMQAPTERHLLRRQKYFGFILQDLIYQAYQRAVEIGKARHLAAADYGELFTIYAPDVSRSDNQALARAARDITTAMNELSTQLPGSNTLQKLILRLAFRFAGEPQSDDVFEKIISEATPASEQEQTTEITNE
jgi:hypothetical protein